MYTEKLQHKNTHCICKQKFRRISIYLQHKNQVGQLKIGLSPDWWLARVAEVKDKGFQDALTWVPVNSYPNQVVPCQLIPKPTRT